MAAANIIRRGSCLCRNVKFSLTGSPARHIQCNCLNCQKASGSAFLTNILYKRSQYKIDSGAEYIKVFRDTDTDSGASLNRAFCSNCGSNLNIVKSNEPEDGVVVVCAGSVDDMWKDFKPQSELFKHRRHTWVPEVKRKPKAGGDAKGKGEAEGAKL